MRTRNSKQGISNRGAALRRGVTWAIAAIPLAASQALAVQVTATWTGGNGLYGTASSWSGGVVPLNNATTTYAVQIGGVAVTYNITNAQTIDSLALDLGSTFNLQAASLFQPTNLTVLGSTLIGGAINANNASFTAMGSGTNFLGSNVSVSAINAAVVRIGATSFNANTAGNRVLLNASGANSILDLPALQFINSGFNSGNSGSSNTISATDQATINLPVVKTLTAPGNSAYSLNVFAGGGATINLSSLQSVGGTSLDTGNTNISADNGAVTLGPLQMANRMFVNLSSGSTMSAGGFAGNVNITSSTIAVSSGARFNGATMVGDYAVRGLVNTTMLSATGAGSVLDLSGLRLLDAGFSSGNSGSTNSVVASNGASLSLAGVKTLVAPANSAYNLSFNASGGAGINLMSLQTVSGVTLDSGNTVFSADNAVFTLGPLQTANRIFVGLQNGATMTVGGYAGNASITNSTFAAASGARLNGASLIGDYSVRSLINTNFISSTGLGTVIDLSGLQLIDAGFSSGNSGTTDTVVAGDRSFINLSGVKTLIAPSNAAYNLSFVATGGASINLASLRTVGGLTLDTGTTNFSADNASLTVGPLQSANRMFVGLQNGATMTVGGYAGTANITNSVFTATSGARLLGATLAGDYSVRNFINTNVLNASGTGTVLDLSGLQSINSAFNTGNSGTTNTITASDRALMDLSGVRTIVGPGNPVYALAFNVNTGASMRLASLQTIDTSTGGQVQFNVASGGNLAMRGIAAGNSVRFNLTDAGSTLNVTGNLSLLAGSSMVAGAGTGISIAGSFSFRQTVESQVDIDSTTVSFGNAGGQTLEVGGRRLASPPVGAFINDNFAIGELDLGLTGTTTLTLVDEFDNGNRSGSSEVLYLNGAGGNGLRILAGSTLFINLLDLYTTENGVWVHINERFTNGVSVIPYDQGYIALTVPEPGSWALLAGGLTAVLTLLRRRQIEA